MSTDTPSPPLVTYARLAGVGYLAIIVTGIFAEFFVRGSLVVAGDAGATAVNITASESLFRQAIGAEMVMLICDVALAALLYAIFRGVDRTLALLAAFFRLAHAAVVGVNLLNMFVPLTLLGGAEYLAAVSPEQLHALVLLLLETQSLGYTLGLVFFGVHCVVLGYLIVRSSLVPKVLGFLLWAAAVGYLTDSFARALLSNYSAYEPILTNVVLVPAFIGELSFCLWLLVKGVRVTSRTGPAQA